MIELGAFAVLRMAVVFTCFQVGSSFAPAFGQFLFGVTYSSRDIRYLYDVLFATYLASFRTGMARWVLPRPSSAADGPPDGGSPGAHCATSRTLHSLPSGFADFGGLK